jgi:hypothetical protein
MDTAIFQLFERVIPLPRRTQNRTTSSGLERAGIGSYNFFWNVWRTLLEIRSAILKKEGFVVKTPK